MSSVIYPISLIQRLRSTRFNRVISDGFENGSTSTRLGWTSGYFKRRFELEHSPLNEVEWRYLRNFYKQRNGAYDSFIFRDNIHREGNATVRFAMPLPAEFSGGARILQVQMEETAATKALPDFEDIATAAGASPILWFDACRERYYSHLGTIYQGDAFAYDVIGLYHANWQGGSSLSLGNPLTSFQHYEFTGTQWGKSTANIADFSTNLPTCSIFCIGRFSAGSARQVIFSIGQAGTKTARGISISSGNKLQPYLGTDDESATWGTTGTAITANTWSSFSESYTPPGSIFDTAINDRIGITSITTQGRETNTTGYSAGPAVLGAGPSGSLILNPTNAMANCNVAHVLLFAAGLSSAQHKALHNLLGPQFGMANIP